MASIPQYYGSPGVPFIVEADPDAPAVAWVSQRARLREWLGGLGEDDFTGETRCTDWNARQLVQHLVSGSMFLGYTLHKSCQGIATEKLRDFDTVTSVEASTNLLDGLSLDDLLGALTDADGNVEREAEALADEGWVGIAEAPIGHLPANLSLSHFVWDSWVHEYDFMIPRGETPTVETHETAVTARYLLGMASALRGLDTCLDVRLVDSDIRIGVAGDGKRVVVTSVDGPTGAPVIEGTAQNVIDRTTGREGGKIDGDANALTILASFAEHLA